MGNFGRILKELRERQNLTQKDLAEDFDVTPKTISKWENNLFEPKIEMIERIADYFNISIDSLFGRSDIKSKHNINSKETDALLEDIKNLDEQDIAYIRGTIYSFKQAKTRNIK